MVLDLDKFSVGPRVRKEALPAATNEKVEGGLAIAGSTNESNLRVVSILKTFFFNKLLEGEVMPAQVALNANGTGNSNLASGYAAAIQPALTTTNNWNTQVRITDDLRSVFVTVQINPSESGVGNAGRGKKYDITGKFNPSGDTQPFINSNPVLFTLEIDGLIFPPFLINETNQSTLENAVWKLTEEGVIDIFKPQVDYKALVKPEIIEFLGEQIEVFSEFQTKIENPTQQISAPIISIMIALLGITQGLEIGNEDTIKTGILMIVTNLLLMNE